MPATLIARKSKQHVLYTDVHHVYIHVHVHVCVHLYIATFTLQNSVDVYSI